MGANLRVLGAPFLMPSLESSHRGQIEKAVNAHESNPRKMLRLLLWKRKRSSPLSYRCLRVVALPYGAAAEKRMCGYSGLNF